MLATVLLADDNVGGVAFFNSVTNELLGLPVGDELVRVRNTPPQVNLSRTGRMANVRDAFAVRHAAGVRGANVVLTDDVTTTGATANEAARTLLRAGANDVTLAVLAKAEPPRAYAGHWGA